MMKLDTHTQKYLSRVRRELKPYSFKQKGKLLATLCSDLLGFVEEVPQADYEQVCRQFGKPFAFAQNILEGVSPSELKASKNRRRWCVAVSILLLCAALAYVTFCWQRLDAIKVTHTTETTVVYIEK